MRAAAGLLAQYASVRVPGGSANPGALHGNPDPVCAQRAAQAHVEPDPGEARARARAAILRNRTLGERPSTSLSQDQYGNYVIQHVLERGEDDDRSRVIAAVRGNVLVLSQHKFASNVLEKCIMFGSPADREEMIRQGAAMKGGSARRGAAHARACGASHSEMLQQSEGINGALQTMMRDPFANYVVQKMLDLSTRCR